jgi:hypothetical protein
MLAHDGYPTTSRRAEQINFHLRAASVGASCIAAMQAALSTLIGAGSDIIERTFLD